METFIQGDARRLAEEIEKIAPDKVVFIADADAWSVSGEEYRESFPEAIVISFPSGEENKNPEVLLSILGELSLRGATRHSLVVCFGGGVATDMGGFAASVFKRGIRYINVPTTLLGVVDASVGGKTGVNFNGLKNEIGVFAKPTLTLFDPSLLTYLPERQMISGYAEMLKTGFITSCELLREVEGCNPANPAADTVEKCVRVKMSVTDSDPEEHGLRRILNFGHTAGHAFESLCLQRGCPVMHGEAVAHGMLVSLILSHIALGMPSSSISGYAALLKNLYPRIALSCKDYSELLELMQHDKKNTGSGKIRFILLKEIGHPQDKEVYEEDIRTALDIYCDMTGQ